MSIAKNEELLGKMDLKKQYTYDDILALPEGKRAEIIDGHWYDLASPRMGHQRIAGAIYRKLSDYVESNQGSCEAFIAPSAVFLEDINNSYVEPDVFVVCDPDKVQDDGCHGAPDLVVEVASPSSERKDMAVKLFKYRACGVREYWIVNPMKQVVTVYAFSEDEEAEEAGQYSFKDAVPSRLYPDFVMDFSRFVERYESIELKNANHSN